MCVICVKNKGVVFPEEKVLKRCWDNNPDMAGFMYVLDGQVHIRKGYMTFEDFKEALARARQKTGDDAPYVLHFRISTQGYDRECCQPFPLSGKMNSLKKCKSKANIGVAHNGVLSLTSDGGKDYSDTMKFITDYLVNIIQGFDYYENQQTVRLIENLISGSRFSILDKFGHCSLFGQGWIKDKSTGCFFSNNSYEREKRVYQAFSDAYWKNWKNYNWNAYDYWDDWDDIRPSNGNAVADIEADKVDDILDNSMPPYNFKHGCCPHSIYDEDTYCDRDLCMEYVSCPYVKECQAQSLVDAKAVNPAFFRKVTSPKMKQIK